VASALLLALALGLLPLLHLHLRAAGLLLRFAGDGAPPGGIAAYGLHGFTEEDAPFERGGTSIPARLYRPRGVENPPGLVIIHGIHQLGRNEPRLMRFARMMAGAGVAVLTPEVQSLADYRVEPSAIGVMGDAVRALRARLGPDARPVGLMGLSFAGGLALLTAREPAYEKDIGYVVTVGAHDDMARVARFFVTNEIPYPDGSALRLAAHEYGALVLVYEYAEGFFPPEDVAVAREVIRAALKEDFTAAKERAQALGPKSRERLEAVAQHRLESFREDLLRVVAAHPEEMAAVSPHGKLDGVRVPVLILHGATDDVIPASEARWLERGLPSGLPRHVLVTEAFQHVELRGKPTVRDQVQLIRFISTLLGLSRG
jgi:dienelactone hydrolase